MGLTGQEQRSEKGNDAHAASAWGGVLKLPRAGSPHDVPAGRRVAVAARPASRPTPCHLVKFTGSQTRANTGTPPILPGRKTHVFAASRAG